jgi:hypothetical protein
MWFQPGCDSLWTDAFLTICRFAVLQFGGNEANNLVSCMELSPYYKELILLFDWSDINVIVSSICPSFSCI